MDGATGRLGQALGLTRRALLRGAAASPLLASGTGAGLRAGVGAGLGLALGTGCAVGTGGAPGAGAVEFGDPVTVTFWHTLTGTQQRTLDEFAAKFNTSNGKNITLKPEYGGTRNQIQPKTVQALQAGNPPSAVVAHDGLLAELGRLGAVVDLAGYLEKGPSPFSKEALADLFPVFVSGGRYEDRRVLGFPFAKGLAVQYVNEDAVARVSGGNGKLGGAAFEEFKRIVGGVTRREVSGRTSTYGHYIKRDGALVDAFILANGGEVFSRDLTRVRFNEPAGVEVLDMWAEMARTGQAYMSDGFNYQVDFGQAKVLSLHDWSMNRSFLREEAGNRFRWSIGLLPQKDPAKPVTVTSGDDVALLQTSPLKQAAAWEWLKFLAEKDQTAIWAARTGYLPLRRSAAEHAELKALWEREPQAKQVFDLIRYARPEPNTPAWPEVREILQNALQAVVNGRTGTAKAVLEEAAKQASKVLEERK